MSIWSAPDDRNLWQNRQYRQRKSILRALPRLVLLAVLVLCRQGSAAAADPQVSGESYLRGVLAAVRSLPSVTARLRHQARLNEQTLVGSGKYWQQRTSNRLVSRWEMQTQIADQSASYVQIFDGTHLWTDRHLPSGRRVHRLDVARLESMLHHDAKLKISQSIPQGQGGLEQMLLDLLTHYRFQPPRPTQLNGLAVNALVGRWKPPQLATLWPEAETAGADLERWPKQLPHHVLVLVGQTTMFPHLIEYRRPEDASLVQGMSGLQPARDPLLRYELYEVQFAVAIEPHLFQFKPGDVQWFDETMAVYDALKKQRETVRAMAAQPEAQILQR